MNRSTTKALLLVFAIAAVGAFQNCQPSGGAAAAASSVSALGGGSAYKGADVAKVVSTLTLPATGSAPSVRTFRVTLTLNSFAQTVAAASEQQDASGNWAQVCANHFTDVAPLVTAGTSYKNLLQYIDGTEYVAGSTYDSSQSINGALTGTLQYQLLDGSTRGISIANDGTKGYPALDLFGGSQTASVNFVALLKHLTTSCN